MQAFLLSTRAGGAGLNLIGANHLVLYDLGELLGTMTIQLACIFRCKHCGHCCGPPLHKAQQGFSGSALRVIAGFLLSLYCRLEPCC